MNLGPHGKEELEMLWSLKLYCHHDGDHTLRSVHIIQAFRFEDIKPQVYELMGLEDEDLDWADLRGPFNGAYYITVSELDPGECEKLYIENLNEDEIKVWQNQNKCNLFTLERAAWLMSLEQEFKDNWEEGHKITSEYNHGGQRS